MRDNNIVSSHPCRRYSLKWNKAKIEILTPHKRRSQPDPRFCNPQFCAPGRTELEKYSIFIVNECSGQETHRSRIDKSAKLATSDKSSFCLEL